MNLTGHNPGRPRLLGFRGSSGGAGHLLDRPDLHPPHQGEQASFPAWVYQAMEYALLQQLAAQVAPVRIEFHGRSPFAVLGWKLGSVTDTAPLGYPNTTEVYWVMAHLTPQVLRTRAATRGPITPNFVFQVHNPQHPGDLRFQAISLFTRLPTAERLALDTTTEAGRLYLQLGPPTFVSATHHGEAAFLMCEEGVDTLTTTLCLKAQQVDLLGVLRDYLADLQRIVRNKPRRR